MIPTRLRSKFDSGSVVGFDPKFGQIIVMHDLLFRIGAVPSQLVSSYAEKKCREISNTIVWLPPLVSDLVTAKDEIVRKFPQLLAGWNRLILTRHTDVALLVEYVFLNTQQRISVNVDVALYFSGDYLLPVSYINGENCDTYTM